MRIGRPQRLRGPDAWAALSPALLLGRDQGVVDLSRRNRGRTGGQTLGVCLEDGTGRKGSEHQTPGDLTAHIDVGGGEGSPNNQGPPWDTA